MSRRPLDTNPRPELERKGLRFPEAEGPASGDGGPILGSDAKQTVTENVAAVELAKEKGGNKKGAGGGNAGGNSAKSFSSQRYKNALRRRLLLDAGDPTVYNDNWVTPDNFVLDSYWNVSGAGSPAGLIPAVVTNEYTAFGLRIVCFAWSADGMFFTIGDSASDTCKTWSVATAFDISTAVARTGTSGQTNPYKCFFSGDGAYFCTMDSSPTTTARVFTTTFPYRQNTTGTGASNATEAALGYDQLAAWFMTNDGNYVITWGNETTTLHQEIRVGQNGTPYNIGTLGTQTQSGDLPAATWSGSNEIQDSVWMNQTGTKVYLLNSNTIYTGTMSTPYDASTLTMDATNKRVCTSAAHGIPGAVNLNGMWMRNDHKEIYLWDDTVNDAYLVRYVNTHPDFV